MVEHNEVCLNINGKQTVKLTIGSIEFKNYFKQLPAPFKIYADFKPLLKGVMGSDETNNTLYTEKYQDHILCNFAYKVLCVDHKFINQFYRGKMWFIDLLRSQSTLSNKRKNAGMVWCSSLLEMCVQSLKLIG